MDLANIIVECCNVITQSETRNVWDGCEFPWQNDGDDGFTDGESYRAAQRTEENIDRLWRVERVRKVCLPNKHEATRRSSHVLQRHCCLKRHHRGLEQEGHSDACD